MHYNLASLFVAIALTLASTVATAQQPSPAPTPGAQNPALVQLQRVPAPCPPGVSGSCWKIIDGRGNTILLPGQVSPGQTSFGIAHNPPDVAIQSCTQDSDCPGNARCSKAGCGRTSMWCNADADCKYSEVCDTSQPGLQSAGKCVPCGGHY